MQEPIIDDPRLPPLEFGGEQQQQETPRVVQTLRPRVLKPAERPERLATAYAEIRTMDTELADLRAKVEQQRQKIAEQERYIEFVTGEARRYDQERMQYMRKCVSLARQMKTMWHLCEEGNLLATAAANLPEGEA